MIIIGDLVSIFAPKIAPFFGYGSCLILFLWYIDSQQSSILWLLASIFFTAFVTLCGVIYNNVKDKLQSNENAIKQVNQNIEAKLEKFDRRQERMFGMLLLQAMNEGDKENMKEVLKDMIAKDR